MSVKQSESTEAMKKGFMRLYNLGLSISEIASLYNITDRTIYRHLQEIADANRVDRNSLLPSSKKKDLKVNKEELFKELSTEEVMDLLKRLLSQTQQILEDVEAIIMTGGTNNEQ